MQPSLDDELDAPICRDVWSCGRVLVDAVDTRSMATAYLAAVAALALLTVLPGPDVAIVTRFSLSGGTTAGVSAAFGVVGGLVVWGH